MKEWCLQRGLDLKLDDAERLMIVSKWMTAIIPKKSWLPLYRILGELLEVEDERRDSRMRSTRELGGVDAERTPRRPKNVPF
jgi:hypothetical protein